MQAAFVLLAALTELVLGSADVAQHVKSKDALTRATAARVAVARGVTAVVPQLREALASETDHDAAREQVRAIVMLGSDDDVAFAASRLPRYPASIDTVFADAVARLDGTRPIDLYFKHVQPLRQAFGFFEVALWGRAQLVDAIAARLLGAKDERAWNDLLNGLGPKLTIGDAIAGVAANGDSEKIRLATLRHLLDRGRPIELAPRESMSVEEAFLRELLRRTAGGKAIEKKEWNEWLAGPGFVRVELAQKLLTRAEQRAMKMPPFMASPASEVPQPEFTLPVVLPRGLAANVLSEAGCTTGWFGAYAARVDAMGRVMSLDLDKLNGEKPCINALGALLRLALAQPLKPDANRVSAHLIALRQPGEPPCFDAGPLTNPGTEVGVVAPKAIERAEPRIPGSVRQQMTGRPAIVVLASTISDTGCLREVRIVSNSGYPELNTEAILALSKWKFRPGTLNGVPSDVDFTLTISFRTK